MGLKVFEGVIADISEAAELVSADPATGERRVTGSSHARLTLAKARGAPVVIERVMADTALAPLLAAGRAGRFAFYRHGETQVLCGFTDGGDAVIASAAADPAGLEAEARRLIAKRRIFFGLLMIPTLVLITFGFDKVGEGRRMLRENPRPKRPSDEKIRRALER
jgi:hypothetical protein